jgi:hypothetical protein
MGPGDKREVMRLREKNLANKAHKKRTLEITGLFCRLLVCQVAHKQWRSKIEWLRRMERGDEMRKCKLPAKLPTVVRGRHEGRPAARVTAARRAK